MSASQALIAADVLDAWAFGAHRCLLDVGGGDGTFLTAAGANAPKLQLMLHDLPAVAELARARLATVGLGHRATVTAGDFFTQPLPGGADIFTLIRVLHDHNDGNVVALLRNIRRAIAVNGVLLIAEPMSGMNADAIGDAYFGFIFWRWEVAGRAPRPNSKTYCNKQASTAAGFCRRGGQCSSMPSSPGPYIEPKDLDKAY